MSFSWMQFKISLRHHLRQLRFKQCHKKANFWTVFWALFVTHICKNIDKSHLPKTPNYFLGMVKGCPTTVRWVSTVPYRNWYDTIVPFTKIACTLDNDVRPSSDRCSGPHLSLVQPHVEFISGNPTIRIYPMTPSLIALLEAVQKCTKNWISTVGLLC